MNGISASLWVTFAIASSAASAQSFRGFGGSKNASSRQNSSSSENSSKNSNETLPADWTLVKERLELDLAIRFSGSAWFGGASPYHKFFSDCYYAFGKADGNACVFKGYKRPKRCGRKPFGDLCGESFLPGCWHGSAISTKESKLTTSLICNPMARSSFITTMLPPKKEQRLQATNYVFGHILKFVEAAYKEFAQKYPKVVDMNNFKETIYTGDIGDKEYVKSALFPRDVFWNIFTDTNIYYEKKPNEFGKINLCPYFANAALKALPEVNATGNTPTDKEIIESIIKCSAKITAREIPPLCVQNADSNDIESYTRSQDLKKMVSKEENWKLIAFVTAEKIIKKYKGCYCFTPGCNSQGFNI